tara:strand:+ start:164 stop:604 length:441 start_codon:yes stop_codon:yes gene_type:complete
MAFVAGASKNSLDVDSLKWLTGDWVGPVGDNLLEEIWMPPSGGTVVALVRSTNDSGTEFVEIINIMEVNGTLELGLQLFNSSLVPLHPEPHRFELIKIEENFISFKGVSNGSHRTLSYERPSEDIFYIRFQPRIGEKVEIRLTPRK